MNSRSPHRGRSDLSAEELDDLLRQARELPPVRIEKVVTVREALRYNLYEDDQKLDETVRRVAPELDPI